MKPGLLFSLFALNLLAAEWKPITPEELQLKAPKLDPHADAEAIFWEQRVFDDIRGGRAEHHHQHYLRVKIFNDRGVKSQSTVNIPYFSKYKMTVANLRGRTIQPDGSIVDLKGDAVFDKTNVKVGRRTLVRTRSFTLPAVQPGSLIEYQWDEVTSEAYYLRVEIDAQRDIPVWKTDILLRPLGADYTGGLRMFPYPFNCNISPFQEVKVPEPFFKTTIEKIPAFVDEPDTAADKELKQWLLIYYTSNEQKDPKKFWPKMNRQLESEFKKDLKVTNEVKALAAEATAGANTPEEKATKLADFVRVKLKNLAYETAGVTAEDRTNFKRREGFNSGDTAKLRMGYPSDLNTLFVAMAQAAGLEARGVRANSADGAYFRPNLFDSALLRNEIAAIKLNGAWKFFNVTNPYIPSGMVDWDEEAAPALVLDEKENSIAQIPTSKATDTQSQRTAKLKLNEDGSVEGEVTVAVTGHRSVAAKTLLAELSEAKREENYREMLRAQHGEAEITNIKIENVLDPMLPLVYRYKVHVPNYAERTGKRLFFQPNFFAHGTKPRFTATKRVNRVVFNYAFLEGDNVDIEMPEGFLLEAAENPGGLKLGQIGEYQLNMGVRGNVLSYRRSITWGNDSQLQFDAQVYPQIKAAWDEIHRRDTHSLTLRAK